MHITFWHVSLGNSPRLLLGYLPTPPFKQARHIMDLPKTQRDQIDPTPLLGVNPGEDALTDAPPIPIDDLSDPVLLVEDLDLKCSESPKDGWYFLLLTLSMIGYVAYQAIRLERNADPSRLQIAWSVELSNGSPYLLSLGISKSVLGIAWMAGPLSGIIVQPYVGIKSDQCRSRFGKRRPFMVGGALATSFALFGLAWAKEIISGPFHLFGADDGSHALHVSIATFAIVMIYVLDFAINVVQAAIRAFIVDSAPLVQQDLANAWASRLAGVGNITGYLFGFFDLPKHLGIFGDSQMKVLCWFASAALLGTVAISCASIPEPPGNETGDPGQPQGSVVALSRSIYRSVRKLPTQIARVCYVQLAAWIGWYPFLFWTTTYVSELYISARAGASEGPNADPSEIEELLREGSRKGTFALFMFAIVTLITSTLLPFMTTKSYKSPSPRAVASTTVGSVASSRTLARTASIMSISSGSYSGEATTHAADDHLVPPSEPAGTRKQLSRVISRSPSIEIPGLTLRRLWFISHLLFFALTWLTLFVHNVRSATLLIALIGIPWAVMLWAPFALIGAEICKRERSADVPNTDPPDEERSAEQMPAGSAGVILGIHNVAIAVPQVVATLASSAVFHALQKPRGSVGDESVAWVLRLGGCAALAAAWLTTAIEEADER